MPRKRKSCWSRTKKEIKIITARLIEISLKVDDYVYKQKPISEYEAKQYITEVSSYKPLCSQDERSLQVIEKLTRCMKAIIIDHQEVAGEVRSDYNDSTIFDDENRTDSPVYSINDEDRTQLSQTAKDFENVINNNVNIIDLCSDDDQDMIHDETNNYPTVAESHEMNIEVEIHKAISNLTLKEVENPLITSADSNYSQSILNNYEDVEKMQQNKVDITSNVAIGSGPVSYTAGKVNKINLLETTKPAYEYMRKIQNKMSKIDPTKIITSVHDTTPNTKINSNDKTVFISKNPPKLSQTREFSIPHNISNQKENTNAYNNSESQTFCDTNRTLILNTDKDTNKFPTSTTQYLKNFESIAHAGKNITNFTVENPKNIFKEMETERVTAPTASKGKTNSVDRIKISTLEKENSITTKKKRVPPKKKKIKENDTEPKNKPGKANKYEYNTKIRKNIDKTKKKDKTSGKYQSIPIYNPNVENDLSWMENIRYVREIRRDENDPKLNLDDSFWDNYYLPANWNDNEFL